MGKVTRKAPGIRVKVTKDGREVYYLDTTIDGHPLTERAGFSLKAAQNLLSKRRAEIMEGKFFPDRSKKNMTVDRVLAEYWERKLQFTKSGQRDRRYLLTKLGKTFGHFQATQLRPSDVEKYQRDRVTECRVIRYKEEGVWKEKDGKNISQRTVDIEVNELQMALDWAVRERLIPYNPVKCVKRIDNRIPQKIMLDDGTDNGKQWQKLYNGASKWLKPYIYLQYKTGMRMGEVCGLKWSYIDMTRAIIDLPPEAVKNVRPDKMKGREVPLYPEVVQFLASLPRENEYVLNGKVGPIKSYECQFRRAVAKAGLPKSITTHALRRTRLQIWDRIDERASMAAGGHADFKVHRQHYTEVKGDMLKRLVG